MTNMLNPPASLDYYFQKDWLIRIEHSDPCDQEQSSEEVAEEDRVNPLPHSGNLLFLALVFTFHWHESAPFGPSCSPFNVHWHRFILLCSHDDAHRVYVATVVNINGLWQSALQEQDHVP